MPTDEDMELLSRKLMSLKLAYDQYFLGSRPREPAMLADEVKKLVVTYANQPIMNTALRFKFNSIVSRYQAFKRQWLDTLRKIDDGSYSRHQFKSKIHQRESAPPEPPASAAQDRAEIYAAYVEARRACGQSIANLTPAKLGEILDQQERELNARFGGGRVRFKVVVKDGRAKLTASREG